MFANKDRMPIRSVSIDWNDDMNPDNKVTLEGKFQNARGMIPQGEGVCGENLKADGKTKENNCQARLVDGDKTDNWPGASTMYTDSHAFINRSCTTDADCTNIEQCQEDSQAASFGYLKDKSCISNFYQAEYTYICFGPGNGTPGAKNFHSNKADCGDEKMQKNFPNGCCIYKPKIQVKDNWGWCNGVCPDGATGNKANSGDGCYDGNSDITKFPNECDGSDLKWSSGQGPYTYFNGSIYVVPASSGVSTKNK